MADDRSSRHAAADRFFNEHGRVKCKTHRPFPARLQTSVFRKLMSCARHIAELERQVDDYRRLAERSGDLPKAAGMRMIGSFSP